MMLIRATREFLKMSLPSLLFALILGALTTAAGAATATMTDTSPRVHLQTTEGTIVLALDASKAPKSVENFLAYVRAGHYNETIFHRIIKNFMIQGGGYRTNYEQKPTLPPIQNEAGNGLRNDRGTIAMARTSDPHSATAQFFINVVDNNFLNKSSKDWGYAVFGKVVEGMDVVDKIRALPTGADGPFPSDVPKTPVVIEKATVEGE
ncbi:peptidyl-prolyl cis-trans isomerase A [Gammaproteobacteria bacterium]